MMKHDAPRSSPIAKEKVLERSAENVENTSGEPLLGSQKDYDQTLEKMICNGP